MSVPCNRGYEFKDGSERIYLECSLGDLESDPGIPLECFESKRTSLVHVFNPCYRVFPYLYMASVIHKGTFGEMQKV